MPGYYHQKKKIELQPGLSWAQVECIMDSKLCLGFPSLGCFSSWIACQDQVR